MSSSPNAEFLGDEAIRDLKWSPSEKGVARKAVDQALKRELDQVMIEAKKRAERIRRSSDLWELERYLARRRAEIDQHFDYSYSVLIFVFGDLLRRGRLSEQELQGLS